MPHFPILISEVGPRDGLQSVKATMPTADKKRWITALYDAGLREIEVCSFVPAKHLPQMADAAEVVAHALTLPGLTVMALVPNTRGAQAALAAGVHKLTIPMSASAAHSLANVRKTREEMLEEVARIVALRKGQSGNPRHRWRRLPGKQLMRLRSCWLRCAMTQPRGIRRRAAWCNYKSRIYQKVAIAFNFFHNPPNSPNNNFIKLARFSLPQAWQAPSPIDLPT